MNDTKHSAQCIWILTEENDHFKALVMVWNDIIELNTLSLIIIAQNADPVHMLLKYTSMQAEKLQQNTAVIWHYVK